MRKIEPYSLWIGNARDGRDFAGLAGAGIRAIVQLAYEEPIGDVPRDFLVLRFPLLDGDGNDDALLQLAIQSVSRQITSDLPTLVCCSAGMSRSPAVVAAAIADTQGRNPATALVEVTRQAPADASPALWNQILSATDSRHAPDGRG